MTALGCNLTCDYCLIQNARLNNPQYANELQKNTIQALEDGSFIKNIQESLKRIHCSANNIETISLWGQEQTLTLEHFTNHIKEWIEAFPSVRKIDFSTNGISGEDKIIDLITALDSIVEKSFIFDLQFSYDGEYSSTKIRHDEEQQSIKTMLKLINKLNNIQLNNVKVSLCVHGVISFQLLRALQGDLDKIKSFWEDGDKKCKEIEQKIINKNVHFHAFFSCAEEVPYNCSKEDALLYTDFYRKSLYTNKMCGINFLNSMWSRTIRNDENHMPLNEMVFSILEQFNHNSPSDLKEITRWLSNHFYCGNGVHELKIMYDGTLVNCQNSIFETTLDGIKKENLTLSDYVKKSWATNHYFINLLTASQDEIDDYLYKWKTGCEDTFWFTFNNVIIMMSLLSYSGQIDPFYSKDFQTLVNHAFIITYINQCHYNNAMFTGSLWLKDTGIIRRYGNGLAFISEREENNDKTNNIWKD